jgi:hypothetical protein
VCHRALGREQGDRDRQEERPSHRRLSKDGRLLPGAQEGPEMLKDLVSPCRSPADSPTRLLSCPYAVSALSSWAQHPPSTGALRAAQIQGRVGEAAEAR